VSAEAVPSLRYDGQITIAIGRSRKDTQWRNRELLWSELVQRLSQTKRTDETMEEFKALPKARQDEIKDVGGFVGGTLKGGRRKADAVVWRCLVTLDADFVRGDLWAGVETFWDFAVAMYSTHKHTPEAPRLRLVIPLSRPVTPDEYAAISRKLAEDMGIDMFDDTTFEPHRLMYWPSTSKDGEFVFKVQDAPWLNPDDVLARYPDWRDPSYWPESSRTKRERQKQVEKQGDPLEKPGVVGAFCRTYTISAAIEKFLPDIYEPAGPNRYTYVPGSTTGGLVVYDDDRFAYSHHGTDPVSGKLVNAFDLVRIHLFGHLDDDADPNTPTPKLPSYKAMMEFAAEDERVRLQILADEFGDDAKSEDLSWMAKLQTDPRNPGRVLPKPINAEIILSHGPFEGVLAYDAFGNTEVIRGDLPWRKRERPQDDYEPWLASDDERLMHYFGVKYNITNRSIVRAAFTEVTRRNSFHPIKEYLESAPWDGIPRVDTLFHVYLGAPDGLYEREVTRKILVAAVKRIYEPGCKFDEMVVLVGPQGAHKSSLLARLGGKWFTDSIKSLDSKEAGEQLQRAWIVEIAELSAFKKSEMEEVKAFLSKTADRYRVAYDRVVSEFPRKCVFFGTTNTMDFLKDPTGGRRFWPIVVNPDARQKSHFEHLTDYEVQQIWAEALHYYRHGESIRLSPEAAKIALERQQLHTERDPWEGLIVEYLETPLPDNWEDMDLWQRRTYLESPNGEVPRTTVSAAEIWAECLGNDPAKLSPWDARRIRDIVRNLPGWRERDGKKRLKLYGIQRVFERVDL
jgi:putative DNA primase/helicase